MIQNCKSKVKGLWFLTFYRSRICQSLGTSYQSIDVSYPHMHLQHSHQCQSNHKECVHTLHHRIARRQGRLLDVHQVTCSSNSFTLSHDFYFQTGRLGEMKKEEDISDKKVLDILSQPWPVFEHNCCYVAVQLGFSPPVPHL